MSIRHTLLFILWLNIIRAEARFDFNATASGDETPSYQLLEDLTNTEGQLVDGRVCDGSGYAIYDNGVYINGTASCDEPETFCCISDDAVEEAQRSSAFNENTTNLTLRSNPCDGFTGIICHGTFDQPNCIGRDACRNSTIGLIKNGSCHGKQACKDTNISSVSTNSCVGENACSEANIGIVAESSCQGTTACHRSKIGTVTHNSCVGRSEACAGGTIDYVSQGSCQQFKSCSAAFLGTIVGASCRGHWACGAQYHDRILTELEYVDQSCIGPHACHRANIKEAILGSCVGDEYACGGFYGDRAIIVSARNRSCVGNSVCQHAKIDSIKDMSCVGRDACRKSQFGNVSGNSCIGDLSCQGAKITTVAQSCIGNSTCQEFSASGSLSNSCHEPWLCVSRDYNGDLQDSCRGPLELSFPPPCSRGSSHYYGATLVMMVMVTATNLLFHAG